MEGWQDSGESARRRVRAPDSRTRAPRFRSHARRESMGFRGVLAICTALVGWIAVAQCVHADTTTREHLHVHGKVEAGEITIDAKLLERWGSEQLKTLTPFTDGEPVFTGISFARFWEKIEPAGQVIRAVAVNDYTIEEEAERLIAMDAFIAYARDGRLLKVRDKGPFWIIFPWSERPDLLAPGVYSLSIWQLVDIEVK